MLKLSSMTKTPAQQAPTARDILSLAIPALIALIAHPLYTLADTAIVGRLGTKELAAVGAGSTIGTTLVGLCIFLTYGANVRTATARGAGNQQKAAHIARENWWLAIGLGAVLAVGLALLAPTLTEPFTISASAQQLAIEYLQVTALGIPALLVSLAATGSIRGYGDTLSPMYVTVVAATTNVGLDLMFVLSFGWGVPGAAWATVCAEIGAAIALTLFLVAKVKPHIHSWLPNLQELKSTATANLALILRTLSARLGLVATAAVASRGGDATLAAYQITMAITGFLVMALDALAIAAQTLVAVAIGQRQWSPLHHLAKRLIRWSLGVGTVLGLVVVAASSQLPLLFSQDTTTQKLTSAALIAVGVGQVVSAYVFIMDGIIMAAQRMLFLAWSCLAATISHVLGLFLVVFCLPDSALFVGLWACYCALFIGVRGVGQLWWWKARWNPGHVLQPPPK